MTKYTLGFIIVGLFLITNSKVYDGITQVHLIFDMLQSWFDDVKQNEIVTTLHFEKALRNASLLHQKYYQGLEFSKEESALQVTDWVRRNCPNCEADKLNSSVIDTCFQNDENINTEKFNFLSYSACVYSTIINIRKVQNKIESYLKEFQGIREKVLTEEVDEHILENTFEWMQKVSELVRERFLLLQNLSMDKFSSPSCNNYGCYSSYEQFSYHCYKSYPYTQLQEINFKEFRRCIVQTTCNENMYDNYLRSER